jgi:hypothetical protein
MKRWLVSIACLFGSSVALAALPPPTPQQAEAAALARAKTAYAGTVANFQLCQSINAVAMCTASNSSSCTSACSGTCKKIVRLLFKAIPKFSLGDFLFDSGIKGVTTRDLSASQNMTL